MDIEELFAGFPQPTRWQCFKWRIRHKLRWPQCPGRHMPYAHLTDAELIAALRRRPYDRAAREAADQLEELTGSR